MKDNTVLLFGSNGGIGSCLKDELENDNRVISVSSDDINFNYSNSCELIKDLINRCDPDIIINCSGVLGDNDSDFNYIFNINIRSNWCILKTFFNLKRTKKTKIIFIGSSSYKHGKKDYMLYSASKAALFNMYEGARDYFENSNIIIGLINPSRVDTKMIRHFSNDKDHYINPKELATSIKIFISNLVKSQHINIYK